MKLVIVGGVAGGASAAARARRLSEDAEVVVFERGPDVSFANCGLPYYVGEEIAARDKLLVVTPDRLRERFKLDVRTRSSVEAIDRAGKTVRVRDLATGREYEEGYDKLILAPGAAPLVPAIPGTDLPGVFTRLPPLPAVVPAVPGGHQGRLRQQGRQVVQCAERGVQGRDGGTLRFRRGPLGLALLPLESRADSTATGSDTSAGYNSPPPLSSSATRQMVFPLALRSARTYVLRPYSFSQLPLGCLIQVRPPRFDPTDYVPRPLDLWADDPGLVQGDLQNFVEPQARHVPPVKLMRPDLNHGVGGCGAPDR